MARLRLSHNLHIVGPQYAFDSPLLERTTTSVEKPTRKNSWIRQQVPDCKYRRLRLLCFALIKSVASLVVCSDIFPCRNQCRPIKKCTISAPYFSAYQHASSASVFARASDYIIVHFLVDLSGVEPPSKKPFRCFIQP